MGIWALDWGRAVWGAGGAWAKVQGWGIAPCVLQRVLRCVSGWSILGRYSLVMGMWPIEKAKASWEITRGHCLSTLHVCYIYISIYLH